MGHRYGSRWVRESQARGQAEMPRETRETRENG